jgi:hypothetical protein
VHGLRSYEFMKCACLLCEWLWLCVSPCWLARWRTRSRPQWLALGLVSRRSRTHARTYPLTHSRTHTHTHTRTPTHCTRAHTDTLHTYIKACGCCCTCRRPPSGPPRFAAGGRRNKAQPSLERWHRGGGCGCRGELAQPNRNHTFALLLASRHYLVDAAAADRPLQGFRQLD